MARLELVSFVLCPYAQRAAIVLAEKGAPFTRTDIDLALKPDWFLAISPTGRVPLLRVDDEVLFESAAIAEYLDETIAPRLLPADALQRARQRAFVEFASGTLADIAALYMAPDQDGYAAKRRALRTRFARLEEELDPQGPYFAGPGFGLVDAAFAPAFRYFDVIDPATCEDSFDRLPRIARWRAALGARPSVIRAVVPDFTARLAAFLGSRPSHLAALIAAVTACAAARLDA
ncbi:glutathione S-transferase family protein [Falsiroseomonas oryziterrae]|uniref:glutathione S-transferase family protein n=1 Tax=Falsiroseomonas oryziterrae TaxID=2911368 RepID=UPI001F1C1C17|nr:glutathione S-transferase family protein [Roseomonas sp. NPKOSM-4]